jgi:ArsR family transcriptional regulator
MEELLKPFQALSDETRLRILNIVLQRECCVCEVMAALEISQTRASRNLKILEDAGFLQSRRTGTWIHYSLNQDTTAAFACALAKLTGQFMNKYPEFKKDKIRLQKAAIANCQ